MAWRTKDRLPAAWNGLLGGIRCPYCGALCRGMMKPGERGSYPRQNRARGAFCTHLNEKHPETAPGYRPEVRLGFLLRDGSLYERTYASLGALERRRRVLGPEAKWSQVVLVFGDVVLPHTWEM